MKTLILVRHAKSDWSDATLADFDRPLNERGRGDAPRMAAALVARGYVPTAMMTSPAVRAYTTARIYAEAFGVPENDLSINEELYEASAKTIHDAIRTFPDHAETAAMFGHNPGMNSVVQAFADDFIGNLPTCASVVIRAHVDTWAEFGLENRPQIWLFLTPSNVH